MYKILRPASIFSSLLIISTFGFALGGMDCSLGRANNFLDKVIDHCPSILHPNSEYCCYKFDGTNYCCDADEFVKSMLGLTIPVIVGIIILVLILSCCISCLCCSCCPAYKRRHRGTVYGRIHQTIVSYPVQPPVNPYIVSGNSAQVSVTQTQEAPPQYTSEVYTKQAPYNPNYNV